MKTFHPLAFAAAIGIAAAIPASAATVIDNFSDGSLSEYTLTRVLDNGFAEANISFSITSGTLSASYNGSINQAEQVLLLRDDYSLSIGQTMSVAVSQATSTSLMDIGIAISTTKSPTGATVSDTDTRDTFDWAAVYVRPSTNELKNLSSTGTPTRTLTTETGKITVDETTVKSLWIKRDSTNAFSLGYINTTDVSFTARTVTLSGFGTTPAFGFYADLRANGGTLGTLDNLTFIPEPSSTALGLLALGGLALRRRRD